MGRNLIRGWRTLAAFQYVGLFSTTIASPGVQDLRR
jgi:hypothetical protein